MLYILLVYFTGHVDFAIKIDYVINGTYKKTCIKKFIELPYFLGYKSNC